MQSALFFLLNTLTDFCILGFLLRFLLHWVRADLYNPLSQFILRFTNPLVLPVRRILSSRNTIDVPTFTVLISLEIFSTWLLLTVSGFDLGFSRFIVLVLMRLILLTLTFYTFSIFIYVLSSWISQSTYSPITRILFDLNEPILKPFRRILPPMGGIDLSPLVALLLIQTLNIAIQSNGNFPRYLL